MEIDWDRVLPARFRVLPVSVEPVEYAQRIGAVLKRHYSHGRIKMLAMAWRIATPAQPKCSPNPSLRHTTNVFIGCSARQGIFLRKQLAELTLLRNNPSADGIRLTNPTAGTISTESNPTRSLPDESIPDGSTKSNRSEEAAAAQEAASAVFSVLFPARH